MWHRLQLLVRRKDQYPWLQAESKTRGRSIGEIVRDLIEAAMSRQSRNNTSESSTPKREADIK